MNSELLTDYMSSTLDPTECHIEKIEIDGDMTPISEANKHDEGNTGAHTRDGSTGGGSKMNVKL